jgi:hypothetical protein
MYARFRGRRRRSPAIAALGVGLVLVLGACDTQPATDVQSTAATLNSKGACANGLNGWWRYQIRNASTGGSFQGVGPQHPFSCGANTAEYPLQAVRATGLTPGHAYEFRIRAEYNGTADTFDSVGARGGTNYDWFVTPSNIQVTDGPVTERYLSSDPETGEPVATASGCRLKEINNPREGKSDGIITVWKIELRTMWKYCNGRIVKMYEAYPGCHITPAGTVMGWTCAAKEKIRAVSLGGNPEHAVQTYSYSFIQYAAIKGGIPISSARWCASNYLSGSGAHYRNGRCDLVPWGT